MSEVLTAIDLFCGAGGLSLGLRRSGFTVVGAVDNDDVAVRTYRDNIGDHVLRASLTELTVERLLDSAGLRPGECTLLAGGPPCQGFSVKRRGSRDDPRNALLLEFFRFIEGVQPRFFLVENVKGLLSKHGRPPEAAGSQGRGGSGRPEPRFVTQEPPPSESGGGPGVSE